MSHGGSAIITWNLPKTERSNCRTSQSIHCGGYCQLASASGIAIEALTLPALHQGPPDRCQTTAAVQSAWRATTSGFEPRRLHPSQPRNEGNDRGLYLSLFHPLQGRWEDLMGLFRLQEVQIGLVDPAVLGT